ncbi:hypothetical protein [Stenotrophomonas sp.]|uniref:hypothetical protein n=1 Tax=Stenotrophomonas sp. TaxID=69392 RepID=UPI00289C312A|nr:hypothetical protein [Stenotrophomonas sp.]
MDAIEKKARELLAESCEKCGMPSLAWEFRSGFHDESVAMFAVVAAFTPPEGYVLVPVEPTQEMRDAMESMKAPHALLRTGVFLPEFRERYAAMLAARPDHIAHDRKMVSSSPDHSEYSIDMVATHPEVRDGSG